MDETFDPVQAGAVAVQEPAQFDPVASGAVPVEQPPEKSVRRNIGEAALETVKGFIPKSALQVAEMATPVVSAIENVAATPRKLYDVAFGGKSVGEAFPETQTLVEAEKTPSFSKERFAAGFGTLAQLGMAAALGRGASLGEIVHGIPETPTPVADAAEAAQVAPTTVQPVTESVPTEPQVAAANIEAAPITQEPQGFPASQEPFPSISRSAEEQRRVAPEQTPPVREAISLDELRLMRERNELQMQNDISQRMTGATHPAVDERIGQIETQLNDIANRELQQKGGGEISASEIPKDETGYGQGVRQEEGAGGGGQNLEQAAQGNRPDSGTRPQVAPVTEPTAEIPPSPAAVESAPVVEPKVTDEPHISAIANKFVEERAAKGEIGEIAPGQGYSTADLVQRGLQMPPERVTESVSRVMQAGDIPVDDAAAIRGEEARLSQRSGQLSRAAEANPSNVEAKLAADNAFKDLQDFHNGPVAQLKQNWANQGRSMQGEIPVDLSTFNGLREAWLRDTGEAPPTSIEPKLRTMAQYVSKANGESNGAMQVLGQEVEKATTGRKLPTEDQVVQNIMDRMKIEPCLT